MRSMFSRIILWSLLTLFACGNIYGQTENRDLLFAVLSDTTASAEERVEAYFYRVKILYRDLYWKGGWAVDPQWVIPEIERWLRKAPEVVQLARKLEKEEYLGRLIMLEAEYYMRVVHDYEKACEIGQLAIQKCLEIEDFNSIMHFYDDLETFRLLENCITEGGVTLREEIENRLPWLTDQLHPLIRNKDDLMVHFYIASFFRSQKRYPEALLVYYKMLDYQRANSIDDLYYGKVLEQIGIILDVSGEDDSSAEYTREAIEVFRETGDTLRQFASLLTLSWNYYDAGQYELGLNHIDSALWLFKDANHCDDCFMRARRMRATFLNKMGMHQEALKELSGDIAAFYDVPKRRDFDTRAAYLVELSRTYNYLGWIENAVQAGEYNKTELEGFLVASRNNFEVLYLAYETIGNYQKALENYQSYITLRDSLDGLRDRQRVSLILAEKDYENQRLSDSIQIEQRRLASELSLQTEIDRQQSNRKLWTAIGVIGLLLAAFFFQRLRLKRHAEMALQEKNLVIEKEKEKAQNSERAKHQFLANMSHEIRTPMNAIKGMTDILLRRNPKKEQFTYINGIKQSTDSLLVIIDDILDISKIESGKIELEKIPFSVQESIRNVEHIMQFKVEEKGLELRTVLPNDESIVFGDPTRLKQILINLTGNAVKFTEKGVITLGVEEKGISDDLVEFKFTVSDTGIGIGADRLETIFESFEQAYSDTTRKFGGTGLGLSISKKLIQLHGGEVWVESEKGKGSQFYFTIPYQKQSHAEKTHAALVEDDAVRPEMLRGVRILLVEDNTFNAIVAREELEDAIEEVQLEVAENGAIALEKLRSTDFDLILMDVQMPVMNGYEATEKIRSQEEGALNIPIIAMTANVMKEEVDRCYEVGMNDFIGKPFNTRELLLKIRKLTDSNSHQR